MNILPVFGKITHAVGDTGDFAVVGYSKKNRVAGL